MFSSPDPLFSFGHGLSYTDFDYSDMEISGEHFGSEGITVSVNVRNIGDREGKEVVQLYVNDKVSTVTTPVMALRGFRKISLAPGQSERVSFTIMPADLGLWNKEMKYVTEPGEFEFMLGRSSEDIRCRKTATYCAE